jgi:hypothetical protein
MKHFRVLMLALSLMLQLFHTVGIGEHRIIHLQRSVRRARAVVVAGSTVHPAIVVPADSSQLSSLARSMACWN